MALRSLNRIRRSHQYWHLIFFALVLVLLFVALRGLGPVLSPVAAALLLSYLLDPLVTGLERRFRVARWLGSLLLFVVALLLLSVLLLVVVPIMVREIHTFAEAVPGYIAKIRTTVVPWIESNLTIKVPRSLHEITDQLGADMKTVASKVLAPLGGVAGKAMQRAAGIFSALGTLLLVPIFTFYFLPKFPAILSSAEELIPRRYANWVRATAKDVDTVLAAWVRGQLTVIAIMAVLYSVGLSIVGVKMAVLIGVLTGCLAFIPYVGVAVGVVLAVGVSLLEYTGPGQLIGVVVVFGVVQTLEGMLITPYLVGEKVGLGPVGVLLALMLGGHLFGFTGVLLAVPAAASLAVVLRKALEAYQGSLFYTKGDDPGEPQAADPEPTLEPDPEPASEEPDSP